MFFEDDNRLAMYVRGDVTHVPTTPYAVVSDEIAQKDIERAKSRRPSQLRVKARQIKNEDGKHVCWVMPIEMENSIEREFAQKYIENMDNKDHIGFVTVVIRSEDKRDMEGVEEYIKRDDVTPFMIVNPLNDDAQMCWPAGGLVIHPRMVEVLPDLSCFDSGAAYGYDY